jgi:hypothetical protein
MNATSHQDDLDPASEPETIYRTFLAADIRPVITAAAPAAMRAALDTLAAHLCGRLCHDITTFRAYGPDQRPPWAACETGNALRAGFQLAHAVTQAIAGSYLTIMGFDPATATTAPAYHPDVITPALRAARPTRLHATLLGLTEHATATVTDADQGFALAGQASDGIPADLWDTATAVTTAIRLYRHAALTEAAHVLSTLWDELAPGPVLLPFAPSPN